MRCLYVNCRGRELGEAAARLIHQIGAERLHHDIAIVPVPEDEMKVIAWESPLGGPVPDVILEELIVGETSVVIQISKVPEILQAFAKLDASYTRRYRPSVCRCPRPELVRGRQSKPAATWRVFACTRRNYRPGGFLP